MAKGYHKARGRKFIGFVFLFTAVFFAGYAGYNEYMEYGLIWPDPAFPHLLIYSPSAVLLLCSIYCFLSAGYRNRKARKQWLKQQR